MCFEPDEEVNYEKSSQLLTETQRDLWASTIDMKRKIDKQLFKAAESRAKIQSELDKLLIETAVGSSEDVGPEIARARVGEFKDSLKKSGKASS